MTYTQLIEALQDTQRTPTHMANPRTVIKELVKYTEGFYGMDEKEAIKEIRRTAQELVKKG